MLKKNPVSKPLSNIMMIGFVLMGVIPGMLNLRAGLAGRGLLGLCSVLFLLVPVIFRWLRMAHPYRLYATFFGFLILAYDLGCVMQRFDNWPFFDKISHFLSGILFTIMGYCLFFFLENLSHPGERPITSSSYALFFSLFVAVVWEICEFTGFVLTGHDSQHTLTTGVFDTMEDLIACFAGSIISVCSFALFCRKKIRLLTGPILEEFHQLLKNRRKAT